MEAHENNKTEYTSFDNYFCFDGGHSFGNISPHIRKLFSSPASHEFTLAHMGHKPEENKRGDELSCFACDSLTSFYGLALDNCRRLSENNQIESVLMAHE